MKLPATLRSRWATVRRPRAGLPGRFLAVLGLFAMAGALIVGPLVVIDNAKPALLVATFAFVSAVLALGWPGQLFPSVALCTFAVEFLATTASAHRVPLEAVALEAMGLYVFHSLSGLAAALPWGADVDPVVFRRWLSRLLPVLVASAPVVVVVATANGSRGQHELLAVLGGFAGVGALGLPVVLLRRALRG